MHIHAGGTPPRKPFPIESADTCMECAHQTVGVDMHVTADRVILLDCQPVLSSSVVLDMIMEGAELPDGVAVCICICM